jgi:predicted SAM-dependent methyltransferase
MRLRGLVSTGINRASVPLRRRFYVQGKPFGRQLPAPARRILGLDDPSAVGSRKLEIGSGLHPTPGYIHVDIWTPSPHLEAVAQMWDLPFPADWATEIRAIHALEHVHPSRFVDTLREWRRVLKTRGLVHISVPNGPELMSAYLRSGTEEKWPIMGSILGMYCSPSLRDPRQLTVRSDHQLVLDFDVLAWALTQAGFSEIQDRTRETDDRHSVDWRPLVEFYSLIVEARA